MPARAPMSVKHGFALPGALRRIIGTRNLGLLLAIIILVVFVGFRNHAYLSTSNIIAQSLELTVTAIPAVGMTLLMIAGYVDLSIGSVFSLAAVVSVDFALKWGFGVSLLLTAAICAGIGLVNGYLVWRLSLSPIIVTLGGLTFYQGLINVITNGQGQIDLSNSFTTYGQGSILGIPNVVILLAGISLVLGLFLSTTNGGLNVYAVGGNLRATASAGVKVRRLVLGLFVLNMVIVGVAAIFTASRFGGATTTQGTDLELEVITAVILGGVSFTGGTGTIFGTLLGCILLTVVDSGIVALDINAYWSDVVSGALLVFAVGMDQLTEEQRDRYRRLMALRAARNASDDGLDISEDSQLPPVKTGRRDRQL